MSEMVTDPFAEWRVLHRRRLTCLREQLCTCCAFIQRAGDPGPRPVQAVCEWVTRSGSRELLCAACLGYWRANAETDETLQPASFKMLEPIQ